MSNPNVLRNSASTAMILLAVLRPSPAVTQAPSQASAPTAPVQVLPQAPTPVSIQPVQPAVQSQSQSLATNQTSAFNCTATEAQERLPTVVRFRIHSRTEIEAKAFDKSGRENASTLRRNDGTGATREAAFLMGGQLGVSGDARLLIARSALEVGEVGTIMIVNQSTRDSLAYQCSKGIF